MLFVKGGFMGQVTIEIPQNVNRTYQVNDSEFGEQLLNHLEEFDKRAKSGNGNIGKPEKPKKKLATITLDLPYDDLDEIDENEVLGIWSNREETADEIARRVREQNRKIT